MSSKSGETKTMYVTAENQELFQPKLNSALSEIHEMNGTVIDIKFTATSQVDFQDQPHALIIYKEHYEPEPYTDPFEVN